MKYLVNRAAGQVRGAYEPPLEFSVSGHYVMDIPSRFNVKIGDDAPVSLIDSKTSNFEDEHPTCEKFTFLDEFIDPPNVDVVESNRVMVGPEKRTVILPGGSLVTNPLTIDNPITKIFGHWNAFLLKSYPGDPNLPIGPSKLLYNFVEVDYFVEFDSDLFTCDIRNSANNATLLTISPDIETAFAPSTPVDIRLRFTNTTLDTYYFSDWIVLAG